MFFNTCVSLLLIFCFSHMIRADDRVAISGFGSLGAGVLDGDAITYRGVVMV